MIVIIIIAMVLLLFANGALFYLIFTDQVEGALFRIATISGVAGALIIIGYVIRSVCYETTKLATS